MSSNTVSKQNILQKSFVLMPLALMCCLLWGSAFPFIKIGYSLLSIDSSDTASQILFAGIRFFSAGVLTIIAGSILQKKPLIPSAASWHKIIPLGMVQTVAQYVFFYIGLARTDGTRASIINGTNVFFALLISCFMFKYERFTTQKLIGCIVGFVGIVIINISGKSLSGGSLPGDVCIILSVIAYALSSSMIKAYSKSENPVMLSGWQFTFGGAVMTAAALAFGGSIEFHSLKSLAVITELALVSAGAYTVWGLLLKYNDVSKVAVFGCLTPIFGFIMSALLLGENSALSWQSLSALVLVCFGILTVNRMETKN